MTPLPITASQERALKAREDRAYRRGVFWIFITFLGVVAMMLAVAAKMVPMGALWGTLVVWLGTGLYQVELVMRVRRPGPRYQSPHIYR